VPWNSPPGSRVATTKATCSANIRRATNPIACAEARSTHCASSITHNSGCLFAASGSSLSVASPIRNRSGASPAPQSEHRAERLTLRVRQPVQAIEHLRAAPR
jgi:hypothetical protein